MSQALEERFLFLLLLLRQPRLRMVYVTSQPINPLIVDYYLSLLPGVIPSHARSRLSLVSVDDSGPEPLVREDPGPAPADRPDPRPRAGPLAVAPGPVQHHHPRARPRPAARHPDVRRRPPALPARHEDRMPAALRASRGPATRLGSRTCTRATTSSEAVLALRAAATRHPARRWSSSTRASPAPGNAVRRPRGPPGAGQPGRAGRGGRAGRRPWSSRTPGSTSAPTSRSSQERGGIVEERVVGDELRSPSVQMRVTPLGEVEVLSTHDQVLGGPSGQSYLGCRFPADPGYARPDHAGRPADRRAAGGRGRAGPVRRRLRHRAARASAGRRTPSRSTCARAAPPTRS